MTTKNPSALDNIPAGGLGQAHAPRMSEYDIVAADVKKYKMGMDPKQAYAALLHMTQKPNFRVLRANDSLLLIDNHGNGTADGIMFSSDKPQAFVKSLIEFNRALKIAGLHKMEIMSAKTDIEPFLKKAKLNYSIKPVQSGIHITVTE